MALTVVRGPDVGAKFELTSSRIVIGRKRGDVLLKDRETSSLHASIEYSPEGRFILKDLGSTNGTWVEGKRVTVAELLPGQHVKVGANHLLFGFVDASSEATRQGPTANSAPADNDVSFPSPWSASSGGRAEPSLPATASAGPLEVDLGMPDLEMSTGGPFADLAPPRAAPPAPQPPAAPVPPWPAPPPVVAPWPAPPPALMAPPAPPLAAASPAPPVDPLGRTSPGIAARGVPDAQRTDAPPPLPPLPSWPASVIAAPPAPTPPAPTPPAPAAPAPAAPAPAAPAPAPIAAVPAARMDPAPPGTATPPWPREVANAPVPPAAAGLPPGVDRSVYGVYLIVERGRDRGRVFAINRQVTVLGRSGTEILINDPDISRRHAALDVQGEGKYILRDLNSTNGTLLNGVGVQSEAISPNDKIRLGSTTIKLVVGDDRLAAELHRLETEPGHH